MKSGCTSSKTKGSRSRELPVLAVGSSSPKGEVAHSRTSIIRAAVLITLNLLMIAHFVQWQMSGSTVSPIEPSEAMFTLQNGAVTAGFIFFTIAILATLIFGRFVCGWGCHIVALQDLCAWMLKKVGLTPKPFRSRLLVFVPLIAALYMFVWPTIARALTKPASEPLIPEFTNHLITTEFWATFPPLWIAVPFLFICGFLTVYFLGAKGFCTYACPYGGFFGIADKFALGKIRVTDACNECGHCTAVCTSNVLVHKEVKEHKMVVDPGCMKCMDCVSVCPNDALYFGFAKPAAAIGKSVKKTYSLSWPEEIAAAFVFLLSYFAVWDVYQVVPMLMALGIAAVTTFIAVKTWKVFLTPDQSFYRWSLKSAGKIKLAGWLFLLLGSSWIGLILHSGWIRYNERQSAYAFQQIQLPDELALAEADPRQWLKAADEKIISDAKKNFYRAFDGGFIVNIDLVPKLAWFEHLSGNNEQAVKMFGIAEKRQDDRSRALSLYYRGAILNRSGRYEEALADLDNALKERPDLISAREERGAALWQLGRRNEAVAAWLDAVKANPAMPLANSYLASADDLVPNADEYGKQAAANTPDDPYFHWMLGLRLKGVGMNDAAQKHFQKAVQLDPTFILRRK